MVTIRSDTEIVDSVSLCIWGPHHFSISMELGLRMNDGEKLRHLSTKRLRLQQEKSVTTHYYYTSDTRSYKLVEALYLLTSIFFVSFGKAAAWRSSAVHEPYTVTFPLCHFLLLDLWS